MGVGSVEPAGCGRSGDVVTDLARIVDIGDWLGQAATMTFGRLGERLAFARLAQQGGEVVGLDRLLP